EHDIGAGKRDVLQEVDEVQAVDPAVSSCREVRNIDRCKVEDNAGEDTEDSEKPADDAHLEADEHGNAGCQFKEAGEIGERRGSRQASAGDHAGGGSRIGNLAE